jgi:hypothetical protein
VFSGAGVPLSLAVVPCWLSEKRRDALFALTGNRPELWSWHQHGFRHKNHEPSGKKQEFGPSRSLSEIRRDLELGQGRLKKLLGPAFFPAFTPPWNRCDERTLTCLKEMGFASVSRWGPCPDFSGPVPDFPVGLDLHTRKCRDAGSDWNRLLLELSTALCRPVCGIMLHHGRMNDNAFDFLEKLLSLFRERGMETTHLAALSSDGQRA